MLCSKGNVAMLAWIGQLLSALLMTWQGPLRKWLRLRMNL